MKSKTMKIYISGAISNLPRSEYLKIFADAEQKLIQKGHKVCNPTKLLPSRHLSVYKVLGYKLTLLYDIYHLMKCDGIYMLKGWKDSKGANVEHAVAKALGLKILYNII